MDTTTPYWKTVVNKSNTGIRFGEWLFDSSRNYIRGVGDFNGDGKDDIVITSDWGIGILTRTASNGLTTIVCKPKDTWFGGWRYNPNDKIEGIGDFDGDGKDDILISSGWGIGVLKFTGNTFTTIVCKPKDTWFGSWRYNAIVNTGVDKIEGIGDFDGDGKDEVLISSNWGIGLLKQSGDTFTSVVAKPKDTWFGEWRYNASVNTGLDRIAGISDFNKDGKDDILITSNWGIGMLKLNGSTFSSMVCKSNGTWFGDWNFNSKDNTIVAVADYNGNGYDDVLIRSNWGMGILEMNGSTMKSLTVKPWGTYIGDFYWYLSQYDGYCGSPIYGTKSNILTVKRNYNIGY